MKKEKDLKILLLLVSNIIGLIVFYLSIEGIIDSLELEYFNLRFIFFDNFEIVFLILNTLCTIYVSYHLFYAYQNKSTKINNYLNQLEIEVQKNKSLRLKIINFLITAVPVIFLAINVFYFIWMLGVSLLVLALEMFVG